MRNGVVITESLIIAILTLAVSFYTGAISEAETNGKVTDSINYTVDENKTTICKEFYPKIIITDK